MEVAVKLKGNPTESHCSQTSSINPCNFLNIKHEKCKLFNEKLNYDWFSHSYSRCWNCIENELSELKESESNERE